MRQTDRETITMYADYVCPFCYLGRNSLERYRDGREDPPDVDWRPFDLRSNKRGPDGEIDHSVDDGKDNEYFEQAKQNVRRLQEEYDVEMSLEIATDVDSLPAQVASYYVKEEDQYEQWRAFDEAIYDALWTDERDIGDPDVLAEIAADVGIDGEEIREAIDDEELREEVRSKFEEAKRQRITGVPTFVYGEHAARGAVPPEQLERLVEGPE